MALGCAICESDQIKTGVCSQTKPNECFSRSLPTITEPRRSLFFDGPVGLGSVSFYRHGVARWLDAWKFPKIKGPFFARPSANLDLGRLPGPFRV